jgi:hypothetical protein
VLRCLLAYAAAFDYEIIQADIRTAFLNSAYRCKAAFEANSIQTGGNCYVGATTRDGQTQLDMSYLLNDLFVICGVLVPAQKTSPLHACSAEEKAVWHERLAHPGPSVISALKSRGLIPSSIKERTLALPALAVKGKVHLASLEIRAKSVSCQGRFCMPICAFPKDYHLIACLRW